jgi:hypothetical protein
MVEQDENILFDDGFQLGCNSADCVVVFDQPCGPTFGVAHGNHFLEKAETTGQSGLKGIDHGLSGISDVLDNSCNAVYKSEDFPREYLRDFFVDTSVFALRPLPALAADKDNTTQHTALPETNTTRPLVVGSADERDMATSLMNVRKNKRSPKMPNGKRRKKSCAKATPSTSDEVHAVTIPSSPSSVEGQDFDKAFFRDVGSLDDEHDEAELAREMKSLYEKSGIKKKKLTHEVLQLLIREASDCVHVAESGNVSITMIYFFNMHFVIRVLMRAYEQALRRSGVLDSKYFEGFRDVQRTADELKTGRRTPNKTPARIKLDTAWKTHKNDFCKIKLKIATLPQRGSYKSGQEWILPGTLWEMPTFYGPTDINNIASQCAAEALQQIRVEDEERN